MDPSDSPCSLTCPENSNIVEWVLVVISIVSLVWGGTNEVLSRRRGNRNAQATCVGDCIRLAWNGKLGRDGHDPVEANLEEAPQQTTQQNTFTFHAPNAWKIN